MQKPGSLQMRATKTKGNPPSWFRIENAHVDEASSNDETTKVYIYDVIGESWWEDATPASEFIKQLANISTPNIELHLNSPGGDIFDGVAIYNALKAHSSKVTVVVDALAASAASFIAQAGDEVIMTKAATMMIHDGSSFAWGNAADLRSTADLLDKLSNTIAEIYSDRAGQSIEFWRELMVEETWYNSHEAVEAGLADKIGEDTKDEDDRAAQNKWDLSIFNHAGRNHAPDPMVVRQRIANRLKEMTVGKPQNTSGQPEGTPEENDKNPASPEINPDADTTEGEADERERSTETSPGAVPNPPEPEGVPDPQGGEPQNRATAGAQTIKFTVGGVTQEMSLADAAKQLGVLTEFRNEQLTQARKDFVESLVDSNKVLAPQMDNLTEYALGLSDDGFEAWKKTWDAVPGNTTFGQSHAQGTTNHDGPQSQAVEDAADKIDTAREVVNHLKRGGMTEDRIKNTKAYATVIAADPNFQL